MRIPSVLRRLRQKYVWRHFDPRAESVEIEVRGVLLSIPRRFVHHYIRNEYEPVTYRMFVETIRPGMTVVDVGAHVGFYTVAASAAVGAAGRVYGVEPTPENARYLRQNVLLNRRENVTILQCAAGATAETRAFHLTGSSDSNGLYPHPLTATAEMIEVDVVPLDALLDPPVHLVKIDAEGAEIEVLDGMKGLIAASDALTVCVEWNPACLRNAGQSPLMLPERLRELGFHDVQVINDADRTISGLEEVSGMIGSGSLPDNWYVNLWATKQPR